MSPSLRNLTSTEKRKLLFLLREAKARDLKLETSDLVEQSKTTWKELLQTGRGFLPKMDGSLYIPTKRQKDFILSVARFSLFVGGRGSGKTGAGAQKALRKIRRGESGAVLNPDFENFKISTWTEFKQWIPWDLVVSKHQYMKENSWTPSKPFTLAFRNGAIVICKGLRDEDSARGPNINWLWYDEGSRDLTGDSWKIAIASVRVGNDPQAWVTATPRGKFHWMYKFFVERDIPQDALDAFSEAEGDKQLVEYFFGSIEDNKQNLDPGFYASLLSSYVGYIREQELEGKFVDAGGTLGSESWFDGKILISPPSNFTRKIRYWDLAATEEKMVGTKKKNDPDQTVGTLLSMHETPGGEKTFTIEKQDSGYWEWAQIKDNILEIAKSDGLGVEIFIEQEPASGGKNQIAELKSFLQSHIPTIRVTGQRPNDFGDKVMRANPWFAEASLGKFYMVQGSWNRDFLSQLGIFPIGSHDDRIDSVSGARLAIAPIKQWKAVKFLKV